MSRADETQTLWLQYRKTGDQALRDRLILTYAPLVKYVAGRLGSGLPAHVDEGDLVSYGLLGLIGAIERYDPGRDVKFETYAIARIKGAIIDELRAMDWVPRSVRSRAREIERAIAAFAQSAKSGLIVTGSTGAAVHRELIIALAARHRLPAIYNSRFWPAAGALMSYGPDFLDQFRRAAGYVDRILRGEKPSDLPVQAPTKYELVINLRTAKALGLEVPPTLLARADEVIE